MTKPNKEAEEAKAKEAEEAKAVNFPCLVYRCPGEHQCPGGTYGFKQVKTYEELGDSLKDGWFETLPEAIED